MRFWITTFLVAGSVLPAYTAEVQTMRATIRGNNGGNGKCTIEVNVDGAADVEVSGDMGRLVTLSGQRAEWRRLECTGPLPRNASGFHFQGVDGRGRVQLLRDPNSNRGVAVVRVEDTKSGREGYTFDLEWQGGSGYGNNGYGNNGYGNNGYGNNGYGNNGRGYGNSNDPRYGRDRDRDYRDNRDYRDDRNYRNDRYNRRDSSNNNYGASRLTCSSDDMRRHYCDANTRGGVTLLRQLSNSACRQGSTWGYDRRGIWVDRGCRAEFEVRQ